MLRRLTLADLSAVAAIEQRVNAFPWPATQFADSLKNADWAWIIEETGAVVGFAVYSLVLDEANLLNIAVAPVAQGDGRGRHLLTTTLLMLKERDFARCFLEVRESNHRAQSLYRSLGFREVGVRKDYYPAAVGREHALVLSCELAELQLPV